MNYDEEYYDYIQWKTNNKEQIINAYIETEPEAPGHIYQYVTDDDYPETYDQWIETITVEDIPESFISTLWRSISYNTN